MARGGVRPGQLVSRTEGTPRAQATRAISELAACAYQEEQHSALHHDDHGGTELKPAGYRGRPDNEPILPAFHSVESSLRHGTHHTQAHHGCWRLGAASGATAMWGGIHARLGPGCRSRPPCVQSTATMPESYFAQLTGAWLPAMRRQAELINWGWVAGCCSAWVRVHMCAHVKAWVCVRGQVRQEGRGGILRREVEGQQCQT